MVVIGRSSAGKEKMDILWRIEMLGWLRVRNRIYERVFDRRWVLANMPDAELRRQQAAYWRGLVRASTIAGVVMLLLAGLAGVAVRQAQRADANARRAEAQRNLYVAQMNLA